MFVLNEIYLASIDTPEQLIRVLHGPVTNATIEALSKSIG